MQDYKMLAAGETEQETIDPFTSEMLIKMKNRALRYGHSLEFIEGAMEWLINQTRAVMTPRERLQATVQLAAYPHWKLLKLDEFTGAFSGVFAYLDALQSPPETYKPPRLPDNSNRAQQERIVGAELFSGIRKIFTDENIHDKKKAIAALHVSLRTKYPKFAGSLNYNG